MVIKTDNNLVDFFIMKSESKMIWLSVLFSFAVLPIQGHRILAIMTVPSFSHQEVYRPLWRALASRGHEVTLLTSDPTNDPSLTTLTEIDTSSAYELMKNIDANLLLTANRFKIFDTSMILGNNLTDFELQLPKVRALIDNRTEHFDLVISEFLYPAMHAFAERFKCPLIAVSTLEGMSRTYYAMGNPHHPLLNSEFLSHSNDISTFSERLLTTAFTIYIKHISYYVHGIVQDKIVEKHFGKGYSSVADLEKSISMMFVNTDILLHNIHPVLPTIVSIGGGGHVKPSKPLPAVSKCCL